MNKLLKCVVLMGLCESVSQTSLCTARGRYPNNDVEDCRGYTMCLMGGANNFTQYRLTCPIGFVYSHKEQQCTNITSYSCHESYNCTSRGYFASESCTSYIACVEAINGLATARLVKCPMNTVFNPEDGLCVHVNSYKCNIKSSDQTDLYTEEVFKDSRNFTFNGAFKINVRYIQNGFVCLTIALLLY
ncbi:uncharacterized protein LOC114248842 [Bombyx mandarina]|uniref:Uncharacterized protein LOC114248842 n=1 Tax=Bombyx mandarina TaxID=7092 RepID=A0A6J2K6Y0_BOMMA|nr:uncharacterized protein LOC114248842 [Bombyx mandarina]